MGSTQFRVRFTNVSPEEARGDKVDMPSHRTASQTPWSILDWTPDQRVILEALYGEIEDINRDNTLQDHPFAEEDDLEQQAAVELLVSLGLNTEAVEDVGSRWSSKWNQTRGKGKNEQLQVLYQW